MRDDGNGTKSLFLVTSSSLNLTAASSSAGRRVSYNTLLPSESSFQQHLISVKNEIDAQAYIVDYQKERMNDMAAGRRYGYRGARGCRGSGQEAKV
jgi:hypothetical protein